MSDLFGNHIVGFPTMRLIYIQLRFISLVHTDFFISNGIAVPVLEAWPNLIACLQI